MKFVIINKESTNKDNLINILTSRTIINIKTINLIKNINISHILESINRTMNMIKLIIKIYSINKNSRTAITKIILKSTIKNHIRSNSSMVIE